MPERKSSKEQSRKPTRKPKSNAQFLDELEQIVGAALPADYRRFMLDFRGRLPEHRSFSVGSRGRGYVAELNELWRVRNVIGGHGLLDGREAHLMVIGDDGGGNWICLAVRGPDRGGVFFVDHEYEPGERHRVVRVGDTFESFMSSLRAGAA